MHSVPCILSDAAGTSAYVRDGNDGLIFPSGNVQALTDKIEWCVNNRKKLTGMGKKARELYEKHFSISAFEKRLIEVIREAMGSQ